MPHSIAALMDGLLLRMAEGVVTFDRPAAVRHLATAALRGAAGYCLAEKCPDLLARCFKPGLAGSRPPAGLFQPLHGRAATADGFPFRIVTWDPEGEFLPGLIEALTQAGPGRPFGNSGARIASIHVEATYELAHEGTAEAASAWRLVLRTPLSLERQGRLVDDETLTLGHITHATAWRLNLLSQHYGNQAQLDPQTWMAEASLVRERSRALEWVEPKRWSSTQKRAISLAGVVGELVVTGMGPDLASLLLTAGLIHLGKHTAEGCGQVVLQPVSTAANASPLPA